MAARSVVRKILGTLLVAKSNKKELRQQTNTGLKAVQEKIEYTLQERTRQASLQLQQAAEGRSSSTGRASSSDLGTIEVMIVG